MKITLFCLFTAVTAITYWLRHINLTHLKKHGSEIPAGFQEAITPETLTKTSAYTFESSRLGLYESLFDNLLLIIFIFGGLLPVYDRFIAGITDSFILQGVCFFLLLTWVQTILGLPFSLHGTFVTEARYGFNTTSARLWIVDFIKSQAIGTLLLIVLLSTAFWLISWSPQNWWLFLWGFMAIFTLFMMFLSPFLIEPLFNKFDPVTEEGLAEEIGEMMARAGLKVGQVMQMDASKRSRHSNAYFTGIGKVKRIVLYDTLIKQMSHAEIVAVLAHEIGHWNRGHIWKRLVVAELLALAGSWITWKVLYWPSLPNLLGMPPDTSLAGRMVILGFISSILLFPFSPIAPWLSRRDEQEADQYAAEITGDPESLASALVKLSTENLANLHPHPLYAWFYYSHPPVTERVKSLRKLSA